jgi:hypothetical protein
MAIIFGKYYKDISGRYVKVGEGEAQGFPLNVTDQSTCIENSPAETHRLPSSDYRDCLTADH